MKSSFTVKLSAVFLTFCLCASSPAPVFSQSQADILAPAVVLDLTPEERNYLQGVYKDTWNYLATFVDSFSGLPYDSNKKQPVTSLSNAGFYLSAVAIAFKTGLIAREDAVARINMALTSLEKVPEWRGIPRVWFTLRGFKPTQGTEMFSYSKHVSNLIAGLELIENIFPEEFTSAAESFFKKIDFSEMYDQKTGWLKGGFDMGYNNYAVSQPFGPWHYKFLASEARLTSFYLIAKGFAPVSHWNALVRPIQKQGDSWYFVSNYEDGGAYMPYMASLYIDERDTEMGLSQEHYSKYQMEHAHDLSAPVWGWSASLDTKGEYVPYGQLKDEIVAPYASVLAMDHYPKEGYQNLKNLEKLGVRPNEKYRNESVNFTAYKLENGIGTPWALLINGDVFFIGKSGEVERLSSYVDWSARYQPAKGYDQKAPMALLQALGYPIDPREPLDRHIKQILGPSAFKPELRAALGDDTKWNDLMRLAAASGLYFPGWIRLQNGRKAQIAFRKAGDTIQPWAIAVEHDVLFLNQNNEPQKLSELIEKSHAAEKTKNIAPGTCASFAAPLGLDPEKKDCAEFLVPADQLKAIANGYFSDPAQSAELLSLAVASGQLFPAQIKLHTDIPGNFGFRDAINWRNGTVEKNYLMPSQAMAFLSLANVLNEHVVWKAFAKDPDVAKTMSVIERPNEELIKMDSDARGCAVPVRTEYKPA